LRYLLPNWQAPANIKACTSLVGTKFAATGAVVAATEPQRDVLLASLVAQMGLPPLHDKQHDTQPSYQHLWLEQVHGINVINADDVKINADNLSANNSALTVGFPADAIFTTQPGFVCTVLTADCLPVLITNKQGTLVAAIHAGWRGLVNGIIEKTVAAVMKARGVGGTGVACDIADLIVWLGPSIGPQSFEVGAEVREQFLQQARNLALVKNSFIAVSQQQPINPKYLANIWQLATDRLLALSIPQPHIFSSGYCTYQNPDLFYSYRRGNQLERMVSLIYIG
jgi:YfiH family protein